MNALLVEPPVATERLPAVAAVPPTSPEVKIAARNLDFFYGNHQALFENSLDIFAHRVTAIIGPSGCGKSTHLRVYNRIYDLYRNQRASGEVLLGGENILAPRLDLLDLRRRVGMI